MRLEFRHFPFTDRPSFGRILLAPRLSLETRILFDGERPMKNIALDDGRAFQPNSRGVDRAFDMPADDQLLGVDFAFEVGGIANQRGRGTQLTFDMAEDIDHAFADDLSDDFHVGTDARDGFWIPVGSRWRHRRGRPRYGGSVACLCRCFWRAGENIHGSLPR